MKKTIKWKTSLWFVNYSNKATHTSRTTEIAFFYKKQDAINFLKGKNICGYVIQQMETGRWTPPLKKLGGFFGGFKPSAEEGLKLKNLIGDNFNLGSAFYKEKK